MDEDTIFALATGAARAAIAIIRVSGPASATVVRALAGRLPPPREATYVRLRDPDSGETLDNALVLRFEAARSEVGEDGAEFHVHGSRAVVAAVLAVLGRQPDLRSAEPGEFARRAFRNGKMDLAQLEGLADLIDAETEWQRRQAQRQLSGALREATAPWRAALIEAAAHVETAIDFAEDVDLGAGLQASVRAAIDPVRDGLRRELARGPAAERIREGVQVVIAGPPNAGKSTLLNALVRREAAIVSALAGTTRDPIEVHLDLGGCPVTLVDTAGLRDTAEPIEQIGVRRAHDRAEAADLVLWLCEGNEPPPEFAAPVWRLAAKSDLRPVAPLPAKTSLMVRRPQAVSNQPLAQDLAVPRSRLLEPSWFETPPSEAPHHEGTEEQREPREQRSALGDTPLDTVLPLSAQTEHNLDVLVQRMTRFAQDLAMSGSEGLIARERHRASFTSALAALDRAAEAPPLELLAEELRAARHALERLVGTVDVEDVLGDIFSRFCIGK